MNSKKYKIAIFCHNWQINGANNFIISILKTLASRIDATIYSLHQGEISEKFRLINTHVTLINEDFNFDSLLNFDVVIANTLMMSRVILECHIRKVPHILFIHETWRLDEIDYLMKGLWNITDLNSSEVIEALKNSQHIVYPAKYLEGVYTSLVEKNRNTILYGSVDMDGIDKHRNTHNRVELRKKYSIPEDSIVFIQVGTITQRKGQMTSVKSFYELSQKLGSNYNLKLLIIGARDFRPGEKEYLKDINLFISQNNLSNSIQILPTLSNINDYYLIADIMLHPSINEVLPFAILEACYSEIPVIASNIDGIPEIITDEISGLLINPFDMESVVIAMKRLTIDINLRTFLGKNSRESILNQHSYKNLENTTMNLLDKVFNERF
jgi:glycosyltransferase involved in cell wall biosynthesis